MTATYRVLSLGLLAGQDREASAALLAQVFRCARAQVEPLLASPAHIVKTGLTRAQADQYQAALERCGCQSRVETEAAASVPTANAGVPVPPAAPGSPATQIDSASTASDPGQLSLSLARLRDIEPTLFEPSTHLSAQERQVLLQRCREQLAGGDSRAAVVIDAGKAVVAAYTDELDCVALLQFAPRFAHALDWQTGTRLLSVNLYTARSGGLAADLRPGPSDSGRHGNFRPMIADLFTDDHERLAARKARIAEEEWERALLLGRRAYINLNVRPRDGRPLTCGDPATPAAAAASASRARSHAALQPGRLRRCWDWLRRCWDWLRVKLKEADFDGVDIDGSD